MGAGKYGYRFQWLQCVRTTDTSTGDRPKTYAENGYLWGSIDVSSASEQDEFGAVRETVSGTVRLRQFPEVSALDRLYLSEWDETYLIDGVRWGDNEMICDVHKLTGGAV